MLGVVVVSSTESTSVPSPVFLTAPPPVAPPRATWVESATLKVVVPSS